MRTNNSLDRALIGVALLFGTFAYNSFYNANAAVAGKFTDAEKIQAAALREAGKSLLVVSSASYGKDNLASVSVKGGNGSCQVLLNKLTVPNTDKSVWVVEKTDCK